MHVFRPVQDSDFPGLVALTGKIAGGLTTLPADEDFLHDRIDQSLRAFAPRIRKPGGENYLFVLEDLSTREIVGTAGISARVGGFDPFYTYEIRQETYSHAPLKIEKQIAVLHLKETHRGPTEIGSLFLHPDHRRHGLGRLLSLGRFLFMAAFRERFDTTIIAELRGYIDPQGKSPFWESVGRHFFGGDFSQADFLSGLGNKEFIADLMPEHPIYVTLLPPDVQAVIGAVHHDSKPALGLLQGEGFQITNEVDIFDAGPLVRASVASLRTTRRARQIQVRAVRAGPAAVPTYLLSNGQLDFRACLGAPELGKPGAALSNEEIAALHLSMNDAAWVSPLP